MKMEKSVFKKLLSQQKTKKPECIHGKKDLKYLKKSDNIFAVTKDVQKLLLELDYLADAGLLDSNKGDRKC